jgi:hypothetical protein
LPSRANPDAKYHKPPKPKAPPPQPHLELATRCELIPPEAKKRWAKVKSKKPFILDELKEDADNWDKPWLSSEVV